MTNNFRKVGALSEACVEVVECVPSQAGHNPHNAKYLVAKAGKLGGLMGDES